MISPIARPDISWRATRNHPPGGTRLGNHRSEKSKLASIDIGIEYTHALRAQSVLLCTVPIKRRGMDSANLECVVICMSDLIPEHLLEEFRWVKPGGVKGGGATEP